ncbi:hypothetical protein Cgig2_018407 [Carnegiea gigantea]|uniref:Aminotransferase-like plant mobile domain-containing protein n=1 Tax=Carnegiea gigantea TaxID=171969 RepID=A0A9Q1GUD4_9CARY|nr:hypothetical protein Cgig2_018407 [Carnegiea gigantea]
MSLWKSDCPRGPLSLPWWSKENLKTGETFLLFTHIKIKENLPSYQLLHHDIESERKSWAKLSLHGELSYKLLYWEWLDILVHYNDKLTTFHLFDALYASLFFYDRCSNLIRALPWATLSGHLYDEIVPTQRELTSKLPLSCTYLFIAYHKLMQGHKGKPTIEQWISFWFRGCNKYHVSKKPDQDNRIPNQGNIVFHHRRRSPWLEMLVAYALALSDIVSLIASDIGYCLPIAILASIYKGLNELSRSSYPGRSRGHFPTHFLYAWLAKNFNAYELVGSQVLLPGRCNLLERNTTCAFRKWWSKMFISSTYSPHASDSKRKQSDLSDTNILNDKGKLGSKPKLKIIHSGKPLEPFVPPIEDGSSRVKIPIIDVVIPATPIPAIPVQSIAPLPQDELPVGVYEPSTKKVIELPLKGAENIMDILDVEPNPTKCMWEGNDVNFKEGLAHVPLPLRSQCFSLIRRIPSFGKDLFDTISRLVDSQGVYSSDDDESQCPFIGTSPQCPLRAPQGGISVFNVDAIIKEVDKNAMRVFGKAYLTRCVVTFLMDFLLLKTILTAFMPLFFKEVSIYRVEVQGKPDEASCRLNTDSAHYAVKTAELKHVESRHQELLKELQHLEDQLKDLGFQVAANEHLLQEAEREVINLQGQIDILNATEVMDAATKASLEKVEAYIKESFEDLKNFQWDP